MNKKGKIILFLSSYAPLYLLIISLNFTYTDIKKTFFKVIEYKFKTFNSNDIMLIGLIILIVIPILCLIYILKEVGDYTETIEIIKITNGDSKILDYILAYIVTFMTTSYVDLKSSTMNVLITGVLLQILLGYLYCKANMFYINPILNLLFGYHIFIVDTKINEVVILSKDTEKIDELKRQVLNEEVIDVNLKCFMKNIYILK